MRKGVSPHHAKSLQRNSELRALVSYVTSNPNCSINGACQHFGLLKGKMRNDFDLLMSYGFIKITGTNKHTNLFSACKYTPEDVERLLPITGPHGARPPIRSAAPGRANVIVTSASEPASHPVWRDRIIALLMGSEKGRAPSLNFMDSMKENNHAESQAAAASH
jgi:hypothetical protein